MALDTDELTTLRDNLIRARAAGTRVVSVDGRRVEYGSDAELAAAIADLDARIRRASGNRPTTVTFNTSKGV